MPVLTTAISRRPVRVAALAIPCFAFITLFAWALSSHLFVQIAIGVAVTSTAAALIAVVLLCREMNRRLRLEAALRDSEREKRFEIRNAELFEHARLLEAEMERRELAEAAARDALLASETRFRELAEAMPQIVWTATGCGAVEYYNSAWYRVTGLPSNRPPDESDRSLVLHPDDSPGWYSLWRHALEARHPFESEHRFWDASVGEYRWYLGRVVPLLHPDGSVARWLGTCTDIHKQKLTEIQLRESDRALRARDVQLSTIFETGIVGDWLWNIQTDRVTAHPSTWKLWGCEDDQESAGRAWFRYRFHPQDAESITREWQAALKENRPFDIEFRIVRPDGSVRWVSCFGSIARNDTGSPIRAHGLNIDITNQKLLQDRLETEVHIRTEDLRRSLREKETLLKEVHHRVKNNLQVISSLLRMQGESLDHSAAIAALKDSQRRVQSMAMIHETLYRGRRMDVIDFGEYTESLVFELFRSCGVEMDNIEPRVEVSHVRLSIDQAIPCGLILNELVTNALKYAYPHGRRGEVEIRLTEEATGKVSLTVSDRGVGLPEGFDWKNSKSLGLPIVDMLAGQLDGCFTVDSRSGTRFVVQFPKEETDRFSASAA